MRGIGREANSRRNPAALCWLCSFNATGLSVQAVQGTRKLGPTPRYPEFLACSRECQESLLILVTKGEGQIDMAGITQMEKQAIMAARLLFYNTACELGLHQVGGLTEDEIDKLILSWRSMAFATPALRCQQSALGEIPI